MALGPPRGKTGYLAETEWTGVKETNVQTKKTVEVIVKDGSEPMIFHDITLAYIGNDGVLRLERGVHNIVAEFFRDDIFGWREL